MDRQDEQDGPLSCLSCSSMLENQSARAKVHLSLRLCVSSIARRNGSAGSIASSRHALVLMRQIAIWERVVSTAQSSLDLRDELIELDGFGVIVDATGIER